MSQFNNIEEKVIYEKLKGSNIINPSSVNVNTIQDTNTPFDEKKVLAYLAEINNYKRTLENTKQNYAYRPILPYRKFIGPAIVFSKKVIRRFIKFYIEPIAMQQTEFNNAVAPSISRLVEVQNEILKGITSLQNETNRLTFELEQSNNKYNDLEKLLKAKMESILKIQEVANKQIRYNKQELEKFDELEIGLNDEFNFLNKKTYSQSGEDSICAYIIMTLGKYLDQCTYLDLGANHAKELSNTYFFYTRGSRGVLVEANTALIPELKFYRNEDIILNKCISTKTGDIVDFYVLNGDGLSTPDLDVANKFILKNPELKIVNTIQVETISVNDIMESYFAEAPIIMNIDIEGKDVEILESIDFNKYRPLIIITEMIEYKTSLVVGNKNTEVLKFMESKGYIEFAFTGINSIFIDETQITEVLK